MKKKFLNFMLFGAFVFALSSSFVGCSNDDYDDTDLKNQLDKKASIEELNSKVATLQAAIDEAKATANEAKTKAEEALASAGGEGGVSEADLKAAEAKLQAQIDKLASLEVVDQKIAALKEELLASVITDEDLKDLAARVDEVSAQVMAIIGSRLTSLAVIPTAHVNGIAAITLTTLQYTPQVYQAMTSHDSNDHSGLQLPVLDHIAVGGASVMSISTDYNEAYFHVSPSLGVTNEDIEMPLFETIISKNITRAAVVTENSPIQPVGYDIDGNVLTVKYKKTVDGSIGSTKVGDTETFYMASLKAPIAAKNYTDDEKAAYDEDGTMVYVNSEYVRIEEAVKVPYLANSKTRFNDTMLGDFADETQLDTDGTSRFYVHYHDSICAYESEANEFVDVYADYDKPLDLKTLVTVCVTDEGATNHTGHEELEDYEAYGLAFRFYIPSTPYNTLGGSEGNTNRTDQQQFAKLDSHTNGIMTSKVYTVEGANLTAVGREPIVRVDLIDEKNNNNLIAMRYLKVKWVRSTAVTPIEVQFADSIYSCPRYMERIGTQWMNEKIYAVAIPGGMQKDQFHSVYTAFDGTSGPGEGTAAEIVNNESGVDSYNITWTLTHADIVAKYPVWKNQEKMDFEKVVYYTDPSGTQATLAITLKRTIYKPVFNIWGYNEVYWVDVNSTVFKINPIVFEAVDPNPAWSNNTTANPTSNIYTDLLNGYLDDYGVKPTTGAGGAIWYADKNRAGNNYYYSAFYPKVGVAGARGTLAGTYAEDGVRFVFDADRIADYKYQYFNGTAVVEMTATVSPDGETLYLNGNEVAATIVNYVPNNLNSAEMTYNIKLQEANPTHAPRSGDQPTEAAKAIVGEYVPVKMIANLCVDGHPTSAKTDVAHTETIKEYEIFIIDPVEIVPSTTEHFTDAVIGGSTIDVKDAFTYVSWNADTNGVRYPIANTSGLPKQLWEFYEVVAGNWRTDLIKSNLKLTNGNLVPTDGVKDGPMPGNVSVEFYRDPVTGDETLTYNNYSGTPVNRDYKLFIPVEFGYKWKTFIITFEVDVKANAGTVNP